MIIGLISDTHIPDNAPELPRQLKKVFNGVDLILHAGDIYIPSVLDELSNIAPVLAVQGDDDKGDIAKDTRLEKERVLTYEGVKIWLVHQFEIVSWDKRIRFEVKIWNKPEKQPDIMVYGHTHEAVIKNGNGLVKINPGSATYPKYQREPGTVGILKVQSGKFDVQIVQLE